MKTEKCVQSTLDLNFAGMTQNEGVYNPAGYTDRKFVVLKFNNTVVVLHYTPSNGELVPIALTGSGWEAVQYKFTKTDEKVILQIK